MSASLLLAREFDAVFEFERTTAKLGAVHSHTPSHRQRLDYATGTVRIRAAARMIDVRVWLAGFLVEFSEFCAIFKTDSLRLLNLV